MLCMGIDPDFHSTAFAYVVEKKVARVGVFTANSSLRGLSAVNAMCRNIARQKAEWNLPMPDVVAVEAMEIYAGRGLGSRHKRPQDLSNLSIVTGAAAEAFYDPDKAERLCLFLPKDWKGQVAKPVHHQRLVQELGWSYELGDKGPINVRPTYNVPGWDTLENAHLSHVLDAIGIAFAGQHSIGVRADIL